MKKLKSKKLIIHEGLKKKKKRLYYVFNVVPINCVFTRVANAITEKKFECFT